MFKSKKQEKKQGAEKKDSNPYFAARKEWNERYGNYITSAKNWRIAAIGSICVSAIAVLGLVYVSGQHKIVPFAVEFDANGDITRVTRTVDASTPSSKQIASGLRQWVIGARTVYSDFQAQKSIIDKTYAMTYPDSACYQNLANYHREKNPYQISQQQTIEVTVHSVVPISEKTWQVDWTEITKQRSGKVIADTKYQGAVTILHIPASNEVQIYQNPLGIYAQECAWTIRQ